ncbi:MAG: hypothetical protein HUU55_09095 [Myxococcales bacterium]|nr:hypothetical protein [Myxococcales bacterium]
MITQDQQLAPLRDTCNAEGTFDAQSPLYFVGGNQNVCELVYALPMLRARNVVMDSSGRMTYSLRRASIGVPEPDFYTTSVAPPQDPTTQTADVPINLARLGSRFDALKIDVEAAALGRSYNPRDWRLQSVVTLVLRKLDKAVAQGQGTESPAWFKGLKSLVTRSSATTTSADTDAFLALSSVYPNGAGAGEGPCCLVGNNDLLKALMNTGAGQTGLSGWRHDPWVDRPVYHFMGIPFYRTQVESVASTTTLYALNLGRTGVNLIYAYGNPKTFGLEVNELATDVSTGKTAYLVHGAFALALWEEEAAFKVTSVPV